MRIGAIDVGTNSIHLVVVEIDESLADARTVYKAREMVRLGSDDALERGNLARKAIARGVDAIGRFVEIARQRGAELIRAVATSAVREADNASEFVEAVRRRTGIEVDVLPEREEARLIYLGVSRGYPIYDRLACIIDIGGGSTEFIVADGNRPYVLESVKLGSLRLYDAFLRDVRDVQSAYERLVHHIRATMRPVVDRLREYRFDLMIGTSGTIMGLAALDAAQRDDVPERQHGYTLPLERLETLERRMLGMTEAQRRRMRGMNPRRADIIVAGGAVLIEAMLALEAEAVVISERALREGIVVDVIERERGVVRVGDAIRSRRLGAVESLAKRYAADGLHERHVARLAVTLFDRLRDLEEIGPKDRELLYAAARLHDVGRFVNASGHHKHGAYLIRNTSVEGWLPEELDLLAAIVRYHRKALPKLDHPEFAALSVADRRRITFLAGILRIADGLDARHLGIVEDLEVIFERGAIAIRVHAPGEATPEIEGGAFKSDLLRKTLGRDVLFRPAAGRERAALGS